MTEPLGSPGETCRECHAPLAADQRYCLTCGARRGDTRVPVPGVVRTPATVAVPAAARGGSTAVVAGVATLVLAMGVGVLIGRAGHDGTPARAAAAPQVIRVSGGAAAAPAETTAEDISSTSTRRTKHRRAAAKKKASSTVAHKTKATNPKLKQLSSASGSDYSKQSKKLPKELGTGGKPPPKDHKKPAGGGGFEDIG